MNDGVAHGSPDRHATLPSVRPTQRGSHLAADFAADRFFAVRFFRAGVPRGADSAAPSAPDSRAIASRDRA